MVKDVERGTYTLDFRIESDDGAEQFQILLHDRFFMNANPMAAVYPDQNDATPFDQHKVCGPDDGGTNRYWAVGIHQEDVFQRGDHCMIIMKVENGWPVSVRWERAENSPNKLRSHVFEGCQNTFERHCRLLGFVPYQTERVPSFPTCRPDFWNKHK